MWGNTLYTPLCLSPSLCRCTYYLLQTTTCQTIRRQNGFVEGQPIALQSWIRHLTASHTGARIVSATVRTQHISTFHSVDPSRRRPLGQFETTDRPTQQVTLIQTLFTTSDSWVPSINSPSFTNISATGGTPVRLVATTGRESVSLPARPYAPTID